MRAWTPDLLLAAGSARGRAVPSYLRLSENRVLGLIPLFSALRREFVCKGSRPAAIA